MLRIHSKKRLRSLTSSSRSHKHVLCMVQIFTEEGRKNKYPSLYNHSAFVVASIHSLVFRFSLVSCLPMLPRILSPIVPLYWWCLQWNSYDQDLFMSCAAAFYVVTQCSSLVLDLLSSAVNEQHAFFSQSQR